jgi:hypothetical protein
MLDSDEQGASHDPAARLEGELIATFSELEARHGLLRLDLAYSVARALLQHVGRKQPLDVYVEFCQRAGSIFAEQAALITDVVEEDRRGRAH